MTATRLPALLVLLTLAGPAVLGLVPNDLATALAAVPAGGTLLLAADTYAAGVDVVRSVTIVGVAGTVLDASAGGIHVHATDVTIRNVTVRGGAFGVFVHSGASLTLENVLLEDATSSAVVVDGGAASLVDVTVRDAGVNGLHARAPTALTVDGLLVTGTPRGVHVVAGAPADLSRVVVETATEHGVVVEDATGGTLVDITVRNATRGVWLLRTQGATLRGLVAEDVQEGFVVENGAATIEDVTVTRAGVHGGVARGATVQLSRFSASATPRGLHLWGGAVSASAVTLADTTTHGLVVEDATDPRVAGLSVARAGTAAWLLRSTRAALDQPNLQKATGALVEATASPDAVVTNGALTDAGVAGVKLAGSSGFRLTGGSITSTPCDLLLDRQSAATTRGATWSTTNEPLLVDTDLSRRDIGPCTQRDDNGHGNDPARYDPSNPSDD